MNKTRKFTLGNIDLVVENLILPFDTVGLFLSIFGLN